MDYRDLTEFGESFTLSVPLPDGGSDNQRTSLVLMHVTDHHQLFSDREENQEEEEDQELIAATPRGALANGPSAPVPPLADRTDTLAVPSSHSSLHLVGSDRVVARAAPVAKHSIADALSTTSPLPNEGNHVDYHSSQPSAAMSESEPHFSTPPSHTTPVGKHSDKLVLLELSSISASP